MATVLLQLFVDGLGMGLIYSLLALGLVLIMSIPKIFFIAYGEFYKLGAFVLWGAIILLKLPFFASLCLAILATTVLGMICYRIVFQQMQYAEDTFLSFLVASIGLMMMIGQAMLLVFGTERRGVPQVFHGVVNVGVVRISVEKLVLIGLALIVTLGLYVLLQKTNLGRAMRAVSFRADIAILQGVNPNKIYISAMAAGCAIAGFAGGVMAPVFAISQEMNNIILPVLLVVMLGGMGSLVGAVVGGLILGTTMAFGYCFIGSGIAQMILFIIIGIIVFIRPEGLFGKSEEYIGI